MKFERTKRIGEEIKKTITKMLIEGHIKNSVILNTHSLISVVAVDVVRDLKYAYVYISVLGQGKDEIIDSLKKSSGFIRREVGKFTKLRYTPELIFLEDNSIKNGVDMIAKINKVSETVSSDEENMENNI
ncbi:MAG: 30S ribosome-binding factor RbfA [Peptostreptococcaceae bacterium]|nr:30S ribosome-binding factor RbfA [Peptostreptococcaceae bacterium]